MACRDRPCCRAAAWCPAGARASAADAPAGAACRSLRAPQAVGALDLDDVVARVVNREGDALRRVRADELLLAELLVDDVGEIARHSIGEVAGAEHRMPLTVEQTHGDRLTDERLAVGAEDPPPGRHLPRLPE